MRMTRKWASLFILAAVAACGLGCGGGGDQPKVGLVSGTVTLDEKPLPGVIIVFSPDEGRASTATTDEEGHYDLVYRYGVKGAKVGQHKISFEWPLDEAGPALPEIYTTKSTLKEEVNTGRNEIDFDLKSK